jgi:hypothetical protein
MEPSKMPANNKTANVTHAETISTENLAIIAGISAGEITKLPGMGRRNVALNEFARIGLESLSRKSFIRSEPRHYSAHNGVYMRAYDHPEIQCVGCLRTLGEMFNYDMSAITVPSYEIVRFVARGEMDNDKHGIYFCFDCAADRNKMLDSMARANVIRRFRNTIADDGMDVYAFVAQSIVEDRLYGTDAAPYGVELRLLHGGLYGGGDNPAGRFHTVIGGRLAYHAFVTRPREASRLARATAYVERTQKRETTQDTSTDETPVTGDSTPSDDAPTPSKPTRKRPAKHAR